MLTELTPSLLSVVLVVKTYLVYSKFAPTNILYHTIVLVIWHGRGRGRWTVSRWGIGSWLYSSVSAMCDNFPCSFTRIQYFCPDLSQLIQNYFILVGCALKFTQCEKALYVSLRHTLKAVGNVSHGCIYLLNSVFKNETLLTTFCDPIWPIASTLVN